MQASPISLLLRCASHPGIAETLVAPWIAKVAVASLAGMYSTCCAGGGGRILVLHLACTHSAVPWKKAKTVRQYSLLHLQAVILA